MNLPKIYTTAKVSPKWKVNGNDIERWKAQTISFFIPLALTYLGSVILVLQQEGYVFDPKDLVPTQVVIGAMVLYVFNTAFNFFLKLKDGTK